MDVSKCVCLSVYYCKFGKKHNNSCIAGRRDSKRMLKAMNKHIRRRVASLGHLAKEFPCELMSLLNDV